MVQERAQTNIIESFIQHKDMDRHLINTHAFHNAHLIRAVLPRDLTQPLPYSDSRKADHFKIANTLRGAQTSKRQVTADKRKATADKKAADANAQAGTAIAAPVWGIPPTRKRKRTGALTDGTEGTTGPEQVGGNE